MPLAKTAIRQTPEESYVSKVVELREENRRFADECRLCEYLDYYPCPIFSVGECMILRISVLCLS
jgi:hypothetical protein